MKIARKTSAIRIVSHSLISFLGIIIAIFIFFIAYNILAWTFNKSLLITMLFSLLIVALLHFARNRADQRPFDDLQTWLDTERNRRDIDEQISVLNSHKYAAHFISQFWDLLNPTNNKNIDDSSLESKSQSTLEAIFDQMPIGVVTLDSSNQIGLINQQASETFAINSSAVAGLSFTDAIKLKRHSKPIVKNWLKSNEHKLQSMMRWGDVEYKTTAGNRKYLEVFGQYNRDKNSGIDTLLTIIDKTAEQDVEDQKVDFVAIVAHELRAPITVIRGYLQVFEDELSEKLDDEQKTFLKKMYVSAEQLSSFVNNILSIARIERDELVVKQVKTNWQDFIARVVGDLSIRAEAYGKKISYTFPKKPLPLVAVDGAMIEHTLINLVDNAIKYGSKNDNILIDITLESEMVHTVITDHGIGIPSSLVSNMFTKFYRSHRSKQQFGGSGIGLYLGKTIVDAHGGKIWVNSQEGKGSSFGFSIPTYEKFATIDQDDDNEGEVIQTGHGWIKNHSLYRR